MRAGGQRPWSAVAPQPGNRDHHLRLRERDLPLGTAWKLWSGPSYIIFIYLLLFIIYLFCGSERRLCHQHEQASMPRPHANEGTNLLSRALSTITCRNLV